MTNSEPQRGTAVTPSELLNMNTTMSTENPNKSPEDLQELKKEINELTPGEVNELVKDGRHAMVEAEKKQGTPPPGNGEAGDEVEEVHHTPKDSKGWDGKLRVEKKTQLANPEAISDAEYSDEENVLPGEQVAADEGKHTSTPQV